ncbi:hypothetical protein [Pseudoalteromonas sp. SG44-8]|uniref:hypothetical protein n=1 Tax=Pseudoalteromonas sp. SG44-8 TaxID=2760958 RepID=UPI0015FEC3B0|nr:hypothetical protein [Pseudoalteromonas sp. SG44-8]MBB1397142.1 hypothetical protein [Pseudoalteromonas sp. SG44-8]
MLNLRRKKVKEIEAKSIALWCKVRGGKDVIEPNKAQIAQSTKEIISEKLFEVADYAASNSLDLKNIDLESDILGKHIQKILNYSVGKSLGEEYQCKLKDKAVERAKHPSRSALNEATKGISLHINYWHFSVDSEKSDVLDIGLMLPKIEAVEELCLYLPIKLKENEILDITSLLKHNEISTAIFNENLSSQQYGTKDHYKLLKGDKYFCSLRSFLKNDINNGEEFGFRSAAGDDGVIISIKSEAIEKALPDKNGDGKAYFRLRVILDSKDKKDIFIRKDLPKDKYFVSGFEVTEYIDFRINETRLLPQSVQEEIEHLQGRDIIPVNRIDFLLATTPGADIKISGTSFHKSRYLEPNPWKKYLENGPEDIRKTIETGMVVYHWKSVAKLDKPIEDFLAFVKLRIRLSQSKKIAFYFLWVIVLGGVGSLLASLVYSFFGGES